MVVVWPAQPAWGSLGAGRPRSWHRRAAGSCFYEFRFCLARLGCVECAFCVADHAEPVYTRSVTGMICRDDHSTLAGPVHAHRVARPEEAVAVRCRAAPTTGRAGCGGPRWCCRTPFLLSPALEYDVCVEHVLPERGLGGQRLEHTRRVRRESGLRRSHACGSVYAQQGPIYGAYTEVGECASERLGARGRRPHASLVPRSCGRPGEASWQDMNEADHRAYLHWRRRYPVGPQVSGAAWDPENTRLMRATPRAPRASGMETSGGIVGRRVHVCGVGLLIPWNPVCSAAAPSKPACPAAGRPDWCRRGGHSDVRRPGPASEPDGGLVLMLK